MWERGEFRRMRVLASQLPRDSRIARALEPRAAWCESAYILANISDTLSWMAYGMGGGKGSKPKPTPRPKEQRKIKKTLDVSDGRVQNLLFAPRG